MLVLTRKVGESVRIGNNIVVTVVSKHGEVRLGFNAPKDLLILREELFVQQQLDERMTIIQEEKQTNKEDIN